MTFDIEAEIGARIAAMEAEPHASADPGDVRREILFINDTVHTTSATSLHTGPGPVGEETTPTAQIEVYGIASPSSTARRGIIRFRPRDSLRPPYFKEGDGTIRVWFDLAHLEHVTTQLTHRKRYLWIGIWPDGYTYADLHSRP